MNYLKSKHPFDIILDRIYWTIQTNTVDEPKIVGDKPVEESTCQFYIFLLCTAWYNFAFLEYIIPVSKKLYPNEIDEIV